MAHRGKGYGGKGENAYLSIVRLHPNGRSPIRKQLCAYTRFQTHFRMMTILTGLLNLRVDMLLATRRLQQFRIVALGPLVQLFAGGIERQARIDELTVETIKQSHHSYPQNPTIADVLFKTTFLENWGSGVGRMVDACKNAHLPEPEFNQNVAFVWVTFKRATIQPYNHTTPQPHKFTPQPHNLKG